MKRKISIIVVLLLLLSGAILGAYVYLKESSKAVIRTEMSERSKEFLSSQMKDNNSELRTVELETKHAAESTFDSNRITVKNCYSLIVPFSVSDDRQNDPCIYYAILESPRGTMTTSLRQVGFNSVDQAPDVTFRRGKKEQYKEESFVSNGQKFLVFTDIQTNVEKSAFGMMTSGESSQLFTISLGIGGDDTLKMRQLKKIADSIQWK